MPDRKGKYTTISIPRELYERVGSLIEDTGFRSPTEYIVYLTRQAVMESATGSVSSATPCSFVTSSGWTYIVSGK